VLPGCEVVAWCVVDGWLVVWCVVESVLKIGEPELWIKPSNLQINQKLDKKI